MVRLEKEGNECSLLPCNGLLLVYGVGALVICSGDKWIMYVFVLAFLAHSLFLSSSIPFRHHFKVNVTCSQHFKKIFKHPEKLKGLVNTISQEFYVFIVFQLIAVLLIFRLCHLLLTAAVSCGFCDLPHSPPGHRWELPCSLPNKMSNAHVMHFLPPAWNQPFLQIFPVLFSGEWCFRTIHPYVWGIDPYVCSLSLGYHCF